MKMGDKDAADGGWSDIGEDKLALRAFAGVEEEAFIIPAEDVASVVSQSGGLLAGTAEDGEVSDSHFVITLLR